jgi:hypothetical protein
MEITDLDEGRLQYIWSNYTEQTYQVLQRVDELDWRIYFTGFPRGEEDRTENGWRIGTYYFVTYVDEVPTEYTYNEGMTTLYWGIGSAVNNDLITKLKNKKDLPYITKEQYEEFTKCHSWEDLDGRF